MSAPSTIRERVMRARDAFHTVDAVVLTTFGFNGQFVEEQVLPVVLDVEASTPAARRAGVHQALGSTPVTLFYDPITTPRVSGRYRYVAHPVPLLGRLFHPKLIAIAGHEANGMPWVYLAVSSANLTMSGWGRNAESFGETWLCTSQQHPVAVLAGFLRWLDGRAPATHTLGATSLMQQSLDALPDGRRPSDDGDQIWSGTLHRRLYASVVHHDGLAAFLRDGRSQSPSSLYAYSPYWGDVAHNSATFGADLTVLVPATRQDGNGVGLTLDQSRELSDDVEIHGNPSDRDRFGHLKAYWIDWPSGKTLTAVGSCNFTSAGLSGANGNVEMMLIDDDHDDVLPDTAALDPGRLSNGLIAEEEVEPPSQVASVVAWDWKALEWRWWFTTARGVGDLTLTLPGLSAIQVDSEAASASGPPPPPGTTYTLTFSHRGERVVLERPILEINLGDSTRNYGRALSPQEIMASWRGRPTTTEGDEREFDGDGGVREDEIEVDADGHPPFEAVNLYEFYRSMRALRTTLRDLGGHPGSQRAYLVGRADSVMALAKQAADGDDIPAVRYLILRELTSVAGDHAAVLNESVLTRLSELASTARNNTLTALSADRVTEDIDPDTVLAWFETNLQRLDSGPRP